jgi:hypothetical protein
MYVIFSAVALPVGVLAVNLAIAEHESARVQNIATFQAGAAALDGQKAIISVRNGIGTCATLPCTMNFGNLGRIRRPYACTGQIVDPDPNPAPIIEPSRVQVKPYIAGEFTVTQTITCDSNFFGGPITATASVTVQIPPP